jgi:putative MATE family efflux protein
MAMDLAKDNTRKLYHHFLLNAFGSALVASVFGLVDMAMMGNYQGASGPAALAVVSPVWNVVYSLGLLTGIGSSVIYASKKGDEEETVDPNSYFTLGLVLTLILCVLETVIFSVWLEPILIFFGATDETLPLCVSYLSVAKYLFPLFTMSNFLAAFLRNDKAPGLATIAVISGGVFNIVFDYVFIFVLDMGMGGAGLATSLGMALNCLIQSSHFLSKKNALRLAPISCFFSRSGAILTNGFSSFFVDVAMGIVSVAFNNQIKSLYGLDSTTYLAVYGVAVNLYVFAQCSAYGIGQASQPIISFNYGAKLNKRVLNILKYALMTSAIVSVVALAITESIPSLITEAFMGNDQTVISLAPSLLRPYCSCFIFLPFNVVIAYFYQGILRGKTAFIVSLARGAILPVSLIFLLPMIDSSLLWWALPIGEAVTTIAILPVLIKNVKELKKVPSSEGTLVA